MSKTEVNISTGEIIFANSSPNDINLTSDFYRNLIEKEVNNERDRRIEEGFSYRGKVIQFDSSSQANILGACQAAQMAIAQGAQKENYRWIFGSSSDFVWITADNSMIRLDAYDVIEMGMTGLDHKRRLTYAARNIKNMNPIPSDWKTNTDYWI